MGMGITGMGAMEGRGAGGRSAPPTWHAGYTLLMFFIMMLAMMLPSATPMILLFAVVNRKQRERGNSYAPTAAFAAGYLVIWAVFRVLAVAPQARLQRVELVSPVLVRANTVRAGHWLAWAAGVALLLTGGWWLLAPTVSL
jgi:predicted metal-binding membrane protein